jgi:manganese/zinc/iron transport system substrate-binding protein
MYVRFWILAGLVALLTACGDNLATVPKIKVAATTGIVADTVKNVGGIHVDVTALLKPGADPHTAVLTDADRAVLNDAKVIFTSGLGLETGMMETLNRLQSSRPVIALADSIARRDLIMLPGTNTPDPHVWMNAALWQTTIARVRDGLIQADPDNAKAYNANAASYMAQLRALHQYITEQINRIPPAQRTLVTAHDAFSYFGRAYGFNVYAPQDALATAPTPDSLQSVAQAIVEKKVTTIFAESTLPQDTLNTIIGMAGGQGQPATIGATLYSDSTGPTDGDRATYDGMMRYNVDMIVTSILGLPAE